MVPFDRIIDYLRISVTDHCNERCLYCMPEGYKGWSQRQDHMTSTEIIRVAEAATELGFRKFRLTGGEPLLRSDIIEIARRLWDLPGVQTLGLSTNGTRLAEMAVDLKQAGVRSVNISLDALDAKLYKRITGGRLESVLSGIETAQSAGFEVIKINCVLMRGVNEHEFLPLIRFTAEHDMLLRFIELMPLSSANMLDQTNFLSVTELMSRLETEGKLIPRSDFRPGHGPARYYDCTIPRLRKPARLGFIGAITTPHFCETCNKLRMTADGKLRPCLGHHGEIDLLHHLRSQNADPLELLREAIANKPENHGFNDHYQPVRPMTAIGG